MKNIVTKLNNNYNVKEQTASDIKKNRFFVTLANDNRVIAQVVYSNKKTAYHIKANRKFTNAEYHDSWSMKYARKTEDTKTALAIIEELANVYKEEQTARAEKKTTKKTDTKAKEQIEKIKALPRNKANKKREATNEDIQRAALFLRSLKTA